MDLVSPSALYRDSYLAATRELDMMSTHRHFDIALAESDFEAFVRGLRERAEGKNLYPGYVPETIFWLVEGKEYIGRISIRHRLNERLLAIGGHIGYDIRPSMRRKGYGKKILELGLMKAKELGIHNVLLTCDVTNIPSRKIIETNGGVLEDEVTNPDGGPDKSRFWIRI